MRRDDRYYPPILLEGRCEKERTGGWAGAKYRWKLKLSRIDNRLTLKISEVRLSHASVFTWLIIFNDKVFILIFFHERS